MTAVTVSRTIARPGMFARLYGLGSVFGKGLRDSRWSILGFGGVVAALIVVTASQVAVQFGTVAERQALAAQMSALPDLFQGLLGEPINIDTLGGFISWRSLGLMPVIVGIWSLVALSGTLTGEASRGSLDLVVAAPIGRASVAVQKAAAHVAAVAIAMLLVGVGAALSTQAFGTLPQDPVSLADGLSTALWIGVEALVGGAVAFAVAPFFGRGIALAAGAVALVGSYLVYGYASTVPAFDALAPLSFFSWTARHRPLAGVTDWPALGGVALLVLAGLAVGVVAFARRDIGVSGSGAIRGPRLGLGLRGPVGRSFFERLPGAIGWGVGIGLYGLAMASSATAFSAQLSDIPQVSEMIRRFYPGIDFSSAAGILQLAFFGFGLLLLGMAAATLLSGWASDESERRLETVLAAPVSRFGTALRSGGGVLGALLALTAVVAGLIAAGAIIDGSDPLLPFVGTFAAGAYAAALAGVGLAVGGLIRASLAAATVAALTVGIYLLDFIGAALRLPEPLLDLALSRHLGQPYLGQLDGIGMVACAVLAVGGVLVSAWGMSRRDVAR